MLPLNLGGKLIKIVFTPWRLFTPEGRKKINQNFFEDVKDDFNRNVELVQKVSSFSGEFKENFDKGRNIVRNPFSSSGSALGASTGSNPHNPKTGMAAMEVKKLESELESRKAKYEDFKRGIITEADWEKGLYKGMVDETEKNLEHWRKLVKRDEENAALWSEMREKSGQ